MLVRQTLRRLPSTAQLANRLLLFTRGLAWERLIPCLVHAKSSYTWLFSCRLVVGHKDSKVFLPSLRVDEQRRVRKSFLKNPCALSIKSANIATFCHPNPLRPEMIHQFRRTNAWFYEELNFQIQKKPLSLWLCSHVFSLYQKYISIYLLIIFKMCGAPSLRSLIFLIVYRVFYELAIHWLYSTTLQPLFSFPEA